VLPLMAVLLALLLLLLLLLRVLPQASSLVLLPSASLPHLSCPQRSARDPSWARLLLLRQCRQALRASRPDSIIHTALAQAPLFSCAHIHTRLLNDPFFLASFFLYIVFLYISPKNFGISVCNGGGCSCAQVCAHVEV
jgi:hypothetical protein